MGVFISPYNILYEIPELRNLTKMDSLLSLAQLSDFIYSLISHGPDTGIDIELPISDMYHQFKKKEKSGWCYMHAMFMHLILHEYGRPSYVYDYGLRELEITHAVIIVQLMDKDYLIDPYFNRYYVDNKEEPLSFAVLLKLIKQDCNNIKSKYGKSQKNIKQGSVYQKIAPQQFEKSVLESWKANQNYDKIMTKTYNSLNPLYLLNNVIQKTRVVIKVNGKKYLEFF